MEAHTTCWDLFGACMEKEYTNPDFGAVHHLTVAAYMLQHPSRLSRQGWLATRDVLVQFLVKGATPAQVRQQNRMLVDSGHRRWKFKGGQPFTGIDPSAWSLTIVDVRFTDAQTYCEDVARWAKEVLEKVERLD